MHYKKVKGILSAHNGMNILEDVVMDVFIVIQEVNVSNGS